MLEVDDLVVRYGAATALDGVSLAVDRAEMVALVGPNGAGKTTLVKTVCGLLRPTRGKVRLDARVAHVPEGRQLFPSLSVEDNLRLGAWGSPKPSRRPQRVYDALPELARMSKKPAGSLSGGQQQMVAVGRALMADPEVMIIDELSLGLAPIVVTSLAQHLVELHRDRQMALLLIEQNATLALELCERAYVLENGRVAASGSSAELAASAEIQRAYLGIVPEVST